MGSKSTRHTYAYGVTSRRILRRQLIEALAPRSVSMSLGGACANCFPSALLQPLAHLSVLVESTVYGPVAEPEPRIVITIVMHPQMLRSLRVAGGVETAHLAAAVRYQFVVAAVNEEEQAAEPTCSPAWRACSGRLQRTFTGGASSRRFCSGSFHHTLARAPSRRRRSTTAAGAEP